MTRNDISSVTVPALQLHTSPPRARTPQTVWAAMRQYAPEVHAEATSLSDARRRLRAELFRLETRPADDAEASQLYRQLQHLLSAVEWACVGRS